MMHCTLLILCIIYLFAMMLWLMLSDGIPNQEIRLPTVKHQASHSSGSTQKPPPIKQAVPKPQLKQAIKEQYIGVFRITGYTAGYESTQKKRGQPGYGGTAAGTKATEGRTISTDWRILPKGTVVRIEGLPGLYTVEDKGGAIKGFRIDLYFTNLRPAIDWGVQYRKVWVGAGGISGGT